MARILQVCNSDFYLSKFLAPLVEALVTAGHHVDCVCEGDRIDRGLFREGTRIIDFAFPRKSSPRQFAEAIGRMRTLIRNGGYDVIDSHNRNASIVGRIAGWLEQVPVNLYTAHGFYFHDDQSRPVRLATVGLEAALARVTDFTLSQSAEDIALMTERDFIRADRIEHIGNGIDTSRFRPPTTARAELEASLGLASGRFRVATTGRLVKGKGFGDLLAAVATLHSRHPEIELLLIGGNIDQDITPFQREFLADVATRGLTGAVSVTGITDKVDQYLRTADVFVLPSYREGLPRALLEAMATGVPSIATDIRGCREVIRDQQDGLLYPPHDVARLSELVERLRVSPSLRATVGAAGRDRVRDRFDERAYVQKQVVAIERLTGKPRRAQRAAAVEAV